MMPTFDVIAGLGCAFGALLVQTHTDQTWVVIWHPALHILYKQTRNVAFSVAFGQNRINHQRAATSRCCKTLFKYLHLGFALFL